MSGRYAEALSVYDRMLERGVEPMPATYNAAVCALARLGKLPAALSLLGTVAARGIERGVTTYAALLAACEAQGRWGSGGWGLGGRDGWGVAIAGGLVGVGFAIAGGLVGVGLGSMRRSCNKPFKNPTQAVDDRFLNHPADRWDVALDLLGRMQDEGLKPTTTCFNAAMEACVAGERGLGPRVGGRRGVFRGSPPTRAPPPPTPSQPTQPPKHGEAPHRAHPMVELHTRPGPQGSLNPANP